MEIKTTKIESIKDVELFFNELLDNEINFHPDSDFNDFINLETLEATFTAEEAEILNSLMDDCFRICQNDGEKYHKDSDVNLGIYDIYEIAMKVFKQYN